MRYRLSEQAAADLKDIFVAGIIKFGEAKASKYQDSFKKTFELLAFLPELGRRVEGGSGNERRFVHGRHTIFYRLDVEGVVIQNVIYSPLILHLWGGNEPS